MAYKARPDDPIENYSTRLPQSLKKELMLFLEQEHQYDPKYGRSDQEIVGLILSQGMAALRKKHKAKELVA